MAILPLMRMRNWLAIAAVGAALATTSVWAQMHGAHAGGARPSVGRAPVGQHGGVIPHSAPRFSSMSINHRPMSINQRPFIGRGSHSPFFFDGHRAGFHHHHHHHRIFISSFGWPYAYSSYYPGYYPSYPLFGDSYDPSNNAYAGQDSQVQQELDRLSNEVQRLSNEQAAARSLPPPPPQSSPQAQSNSAPPAPTTFVFRNGGTQTVDNYAISGSTLWVFTKQRTTKIPLSEVDVPATQKANEEQGVPFPVPLPAL